jgi:AcrR family transcriptional regulator
VTARPDTATEPRQGLRELHKALTREEIVRCAVELFARDGFDATTVEDIATAAGCSERTVYRYFPFKEDIAFFDMPGLFDRMRAALARCPDGADPWRHAKDVLRSLALSQTGGDAPLAEARIRLWFTDPTLGSRYLEFFHPWEEALGAFLAARSSGLPRDEDLAAQVMAAAALAAMRAAYRMEVLHGGTFDGYLDEAFAVLAERLR